MPPKRGRGGGARGGARAASRTPGPRESTPFNSALRSSQNPGPPRFSTSYGSPVVLTGSRGFRSGGAANAMSNVLNSVQAADKQDRALGNSAEESLDSLDESDDQRAPRASGSVSRETSKASGRAQRGGVFESDSQETDEEEDAARMPPPPPPSQRRTDGYPRPPVPPSDARSFTEENQLFRGAGLGTPGPSSRNSRQETPSRVSARIAARNDGTGSHGGPKADPVVEAEDDNEEDELATAPAQLSPAKATKSSGSGVTRGNSSNAVDRNNQTSQSRGRSKDLVSDEEEATSRPLHPQSQRYGNPQRIAKPLADDQNGLKRLPVPINSHNNQLFGQRTSHNTPPRSAPERVLPGTSVTLSPRTVGHSSSQPQVLRPNDPASGGLPQHLFPGGRPISSAMGGRHNDPTQGGRPGGSQVHPGDKDPQDNDDEPAGLFTVLSDGLERILRFKKWPRWLATGLQTWGLLTFFSIALLIVLQVLVPPNRWEGVKVSRNYTYTGLGNWRQNIIQYVPWIILHPFAVLTGNLDYADFRTQLQWAEWNHQNNKIRLDYLAGATHQMRRILPELIAIQVDKSSNEWSVGDSFWFALDEEMKHGGLHHSILTLERSADGSYVITDNHWEAILRRMKNEGMLLSGQPGVKDELTNSDQIHSVVERSVSQRWEQWLKKNDDAIKRVMGVDKEAMSAYYTELFGDFEQKMLERVRSYNQEESLVSREEFIEKIQHVSNEYDVQIKAEMEAMENRLRYAIDIAEDGKQTATPPEGMNRAQVSEMIDVAIKRAIADAQLEFIAKGNIKGHIETELSGRKNYFSALRGAIVDHTLSSTSFRWSSKGVLDEDESTSGGLFSIWSRRGKSVHREGGKQAGIDFAQGKVLEKWEEDGECWCAGHADSNNSSRIADLSILTADMVIPQHLVVEHITASGSFDPDAMPKDLEVWMHTPSDRRRRALLEWSANIWPDSKFGNGARLMGKGFVKIGDFQYLKSVGEGEKQVFRLSEDLLDLDAQTQQVLVRSKSNYGAQDHTCFYRLRLFGKEGTMVDWNMVE